MHPITATVTPGRCPVASWILRLVLCRSKSVRPHEGQLTNSVFVFLMRQPCRSEKLAVLRYLRERRS
jgi:hypothetical protein